MKHSKLPASRGGVSAEAMKVRKILYCLTILLGWLGGNCQSVHAQDSGSSTPDGRAISQFVSAGLAYRDGRYEEAIRKYKEILQKGRESGALYYNLGNSYFKEGDLGRAVLNYERARRLIPRDSDLNFNYHYAISQSGQNIAEGTMSFLEGLIDHYIQFYTRAEMFGIIMFLSLLIGLAHLLSLYLKWSVRLQKGVIGVLTAVWILYGSGFIIKIQTERNLAVVVEKTQGRFEPREDATVHFSLDAGAKIKILKIEGGWTKIKRPDGKIAWISQKILESI